MDEDPKLSILELIILSLTVYTIFSIIVQLLIPVSTEMQKLFNMFEWICSGLFLFEWFYRFKNSQEKKKFILKNSLDFIASLPIGVLAGFKALRLLKLFQIIKLFGSVNRFKHYVNVNKVHVFKLILFSGFVLLTMISPIMILYFEESTGNINTAENALWWTYVTLTTIGYGDLSPVTTEGRLFTVFMSMGGIGMFSILSGLVINFILTKAKED